MFLPGESQGQRSLLGCCLWGHRVRHDWCNLAAAAAVKREKEKEEALSFCFQSLHGKASLLKQHIKKQRHPFANKGPSSQSYGFSSSHVWMWEVDYKENWEPKNWCFRTDSKEIKLGNPKGNQPWIIIIIIRKTDTEPEAPILWPPDAKSWLIGKNPGSGKDWGQGEKGVTEKEIAGWYHWFNGHEFEQTLRDSEG